MKNDNRIKVLTGIVSVLVLIAAVCLCLFTKRGEKTHADVLILGDSIFGLVRDETGISEILSGETGLNVFNGAFGGTKGVYDRDNVNKSDSKGAYSLSGICDSLISGDFGPQLSAHVRESNTEYFRSLMRKMRRLDTKDLKYIIIGHGLNDYHSGEGKNFKEEYKEVIEKLSKAFKDTRIILITPPYTWYETNGKTCEEYEIEGYNLSSYVEWVKEIAKEYNLECIDLYEDLYDTKDYDDRNKYTTDGVHPNDKMRREIATKIGKVLITAE
ncbi:MAG: hypothetical protein K6F84_00795 [Lachnospiraceae bacterium]|nr:hypothetical protein [Lachnospiraceae bacterium]